MRRPPNNKLVSEDGWGKVFFCVSPSTICDECCESAEETMRYEMVDRNGDPTGSYHVCEPCDPENFTRG